QAAATDLNLRARQARVGGYALEEFRGVRAIPAEMDTDGGRRLFARAFRNGVANGAERRAAAILVGRLQRQLFLGRDGETEARRRQLFHIDRIERRLFIVLDLVEFEHVLRLGLAVYAVAFADIFKRL